MTHTRVLFRADALLTEATMTALPEPKVEAAPAMDGM
jgi:hypothetical protein